MSTFIIFGFFVSSFSAIGWIRQKPMGKRISGMALLLLILSAPALSETKAKSEIKAKLIWSGFESEKNSIFVSDWDGEDWAAPISIYQSKNAVNNPTLATLSNGTSIAMWSEQQRRKTVLMWSQKTAQNNAWSEASVFSRLGLDNVSPTIVRDIVGELWVFWSAQKGEYTDIYMTRQTAGGWSEPAIVNANNEVPDIKPVAGLNEQAEVTIIWKSYDFESRAYLQKMHVYPNDDAKKGAIAPIDFQSELDLGSIPLPSYGGSQFLSLHAPGNQIVQNLRIEPSFRY